MHRSRLRTDRGYTLVELLVAMLILAILVAVGLATFLGQKTKAQDAGAKTAAVTASKALLAYGTDHGTYTTVTKDELLKIEPSLRMARNLTVTGGAHTFTVRVDSPAAEGGSFSISRTAGGALVRDCSQPGVGGCRAEPDAHGDRW